MAHATTRDVRVEDSPMAGHRPPDFVLGVVAGVIAGWAMLTWFVAACALWLDKGVLAPLYMAAAPIAGVDPYAHSVAQVQARGQLVWWDAGAAILGLVLITALCGVAGLAFAALLRRRPPSPLASVVAGVAFGVVMAILLSSAVLPLLERFVGGQPLTASIASRLGWPTWLAGFAAFGLTLGGLLAMDEVGRRRRISLRFRGSARMPAGVTRA